MAFFVLMRVAATSKVYIYMSVRTGIDDGLCLALVLPIGDKEHAPE